MKKKPNDSGMVIVEATIVFPVMFLVIFLMIFAGNAYFQKCRVESIVNKMAIDGAAYCADPMLDDIESNTIPALDSVDVRPYRYLIGGMNDIVEDIDQKTEDKVRNLSTGLFSAMKPSNPIVNVEFNNGFIYSTFSVQIEYKIIMPVRLLGDTENIALNISSRTDMPVSDSSEFIRNVDMVEDYMERYGIIEKITNAIDTAKQWFGQ